jgi:hypothetical protein
MAASPEPMTIDQLKAHMDRRFDRLERTKADRNELRRLAKRCATKDDLKRYATKADFARLEERVIAMQKTLQGMVRHHALILDDHEARLGDLERRR